jgi:hypothetical protein
MNYRHLTREEINTLYDQNCIAEDWHNITVKEGFRPEAIFNTRFYGNIKLGVFSGTIEVEKGITRKCGIYNSHIRDCEISDKIYISEVKSLANYHIEEDVAIENVGSMDVQGESSFGNGTEIEILNEGGGRELPIFDRLSAQVAYLSVLYRHDPEFTEKLLGMIRQYCNTKKSHMGRVEGGARILDAHILRNVNIGGHTTISGASLLEEGTIMSNAGDPAYIGEGVIAKKFIILSGSRIDSSAIIDKSFIGQCVAMGKQFSAENSLFFANCEAFHGEACSFFAGPYTVTHHKSTLMIASLCSFFNAGSGTNQSNHMYKLGPVHEGIFGRGSKTGSFAYLILPSVVGAYTVVMGKHYTNFDTSDFPFSYITEEKGKSELTPAMNIFSVGTRRDSEKWPKRDKRKGSDKLDIVQFDLFNPFIVGKMVNGMTILGELAEKALKTQDFVTFKGININRLLLKATRKYYEMGLKVFIGQEIIKRLQSVEGEPNLERLREKLTAGDGAGPGKWVEVCGMFAPKSEIDTLLLSVKSGETGSLHELQNKLLEISNRYHEYSWNWCAELIRRQTGTDTGSLLPDQLIQLVSEWKTNAVKMNNMILKDAEKEFDISSRLGFGVDGDEETRDMDFKAVRGTYGENKFVLGLQKEIRDIEEKADYWIRRITEMDK